jgi:hypothetical protein
VEDVDGDTAALLNYASGHTGFAAQRLLWFNWPVAVSHEAGNVKLTNVNERIVEIPFAFRALARLPEGAKVLDVGATESTVALSLASLGFEVTALDPRPYPLTHPRLETVVADVGSWQTEALFDAVLCLSTLEHIGLGAYGDPRDPKGDWQALDRIRALTAEGGLLLLTVPFGERRVDELERTYDRDALEAILEGWSVDDLTIARRRDPVTWEIGLDGDGDAGAVALVTAHRA